MEVLARFLRATRTRVAGGWVAGAGGFRGGFCLGLRVAKCKYRIGPAAAKQGGLLGGQ